MVAPPIIPALCTLLLVGLTSACGSEGKTWITVIPADAPSGETLPMRHFHFGKQGAGRELVLADRPPVFADPSTVLELDVPVNGVLWARPVARSFAADPPEQILLQGQFPEGAQPVISEVIPIPAARSGLEPGRATHDTAASATPDADPPHSDSDTGRSAWIWSPRRWMERPEDFWELQQEVGLSAVFISVPVDGTEVGKPEALRAFVKEGSARQLDVWAVIGDPHDVLDASHPAMARRLSAYVAYNRCAAPDARLAGVQLDIEPYLLPGFALHPEYWRERYLATVDFARTILVDEPSLRLELVMPVWWGAHPAWGPDFLDRLDAPPVGIAVMNYRTDPARLKREAQPFLRWAERHQRPIRIGVEAGTLGDEMRRAYRAHPTAGRLWLLELGEWAVLMLLDQEAGGLPGKTYRFSHAYPFSASNLTFRGDPDGLFETVTWMERTWKDSPGFQGIAIHGLEESLNPLP